MLYLVSTPIGNLQDITLRALDSLKSCDYILCEDTRHSQILLHHYQIKKPLHSFHKFNEASHENSILTDLKSGKTICLISDAGTPCISDPGTRLVKLCRTENIPVYSIPGPCACIAALTCSGFDANPFQFVGFLPRQTNALKKTLIEILLYEGTTISYESPERLLSVLNILSEMAPKRQIGVIREITKKFEEVKIAEAVDQALYWREHSPKGEIVLLIDKNHEEMNLASFSSEEYVAFLQEEYKITKQEAILLTAKLTGIPKRNIYNKLHGPKS